MKNFLLGVLAGVLLACATMAVVGVYTDFHVRLSRVEGYLNGLDQMIRSAR